MLVTDQTSRKNFQNDFKSLVLRHHVMLRKHDTSKFVDINVTLDQ